MVRRPAFYRDARPKMTRPRYSLIAALAATLILLAFGSAARAATRT
jgi:hypothetical protein